VAFPLLQRVTLEEASVKIPPDLGHDDIFGVFWLGDGHTDLLEPRGKLFGGGAVTEVLLKGLEIDRKAPVAPFREAEDAIVDAVPRRELREVVDDTWGVGAKIVRAVAVNEHAGGIVFVVGVAAEVGAKDASVPVVTADWIADMKADLEAGAQWLVTEGRESGTVGIYSGDGSVRKLLVARVKELSPKQLMRLLNTVIG
jgi:hypothetical protein